MQEGYKQLAKVLRWKILSQRPRSVKAADLVLGIESLLKVVELGWRYRDRLGTVALCLMLVSLCLYELRLFTRPHSSISTVY